MQYLKDHDRPESALPEEVDLVLEQAEFAHEKDVEASSARENLLDADRADEGRHDERHEQQPAEQCLPAEAEARAEERERHGKERRRRRGAQGQFQAVDDALPQDVVLEEHDTEVDGTEAPLYPERFLEDVQHRVDEERCQEGPHQRGEGQRSDRDTGLYAVFFHRLPARGPLNRDEIEEFSGFSELS